MGIFREKSFKLIKHQKARSKLFEFHVKKDEYPRLSEEIDNLLLQSHFTLFEYSYLLFSGETTDELKEDLRQSFEYFEASSRDGNIEEISNDLLFLGAITAFVLGNFASSKVLFSKIDIQKFDQRLPVIATKFAKQVFGNYSAYQALNEDKLDLLIQNYLNEAITFEMVDENYRTFETHFINDVDNIGYYYFLYALILIYEKNKASSLLPICSETSPDKWTQYLRKKNSIRILWQSQKMLCEKGFLKGESGVISLPTGSGKTKGIELIIQARLLRNELKKVLIVAPLKALVNEIKEELKTHYGNAIVNSISDANVDDYNQITASDEFQIVVITPEKLTYILHHQTAFIDLFQLIVFDEAHMIMENNRGTRYELLLMYVKSHITDRHQLVLLTAVITNPDEICRWFFDGRAGQTVDNKKLFSTSKSIGFYNPATNSIIFYENSISEDRNCDYIVPRILHLTPKERLDKNTSTICLTEQISAKGPTVIYCPQQNRLQGFLKRVIEIVPPCEQSAELSKISNFIKSNYGENSYIYNATAHGYYCHYGHIQNGIKLLIENSFKTGLVSKLIATSTLSEGVNLPIKNFVITGTRIGTDLMNVSKFKNLYGRAVRPGKFTNGNVISMELVNDNMDSRKMHYIIARYGKYIDEKAEAPCYSSIDIKAMHYFLSQECFRPQDINRAVEIIYNEEMYEGLLANESFVSFLKLFYSSLLSNKSFTETVESIESYLSIVLAGSSDLSACSFKAVIDISKKTFAYSTEKDDFFKSFISLLFAAIGVDYLLMDLEKRIVFTSSMCTKKCLDVILPWSDALDYSADLPVAICNEVSKLYYDSFFADKYVNRKKQPKVNQDEFCQLLNDWISGYSVFEICSRNPQNKCLASIDFVEKIVREVFDYDLPLFVSSVLDILRQKEEHMVFDGMITINVNEECASSLTQFIEKMKSGLPDFLSIEFYKNIFQDRLLSIKLRNLLRDNDISFDEAIAKIKNNKEFVLKSFESDPTYFVNKLKEAITE